MFPVGLEPTTFGFGGRRSIQLSYGNLFAPNLSQIGHRVYRRYFQGAQGQEHGDFFAD